MIRLGSRLCVASYRDAALSADEILILIRPSDAFGDGHHATTQICLELLEQEICGGELVLDVGTGSGILAITAAKLGARRVIAAEIDAAACQAAFMNLDLNGVEKIVHVYQGSVEALCPRATFDLIVVNLYNANQLLAVYPFLAGRLAAGGRMICGGIWTRREEEFKGLLSGGGFSVRHTRRRDAFIAFVATLEERAADSVPSPAAAVHPARESQSGLPNRHAAGELTGTRPRADGPAPTPLVPRKHRHARREEEVEELPTGLGGDPV